MSFARAILAAALLSCFPLLAKAGDAARDCLTETQARETVKLEGLAAPASAQREAARHAGAELLRGRLCRWNADYVYEITLLRRDGRVTHVFVSARDGLVIEGAPGEFARN